MQTEAALYFGKVFHRRLRPVRHELAYSVFYMLLDLDALERVSDRSWLFSYNRFSLFSFFDRDHGAGASRPLRPWVEAQLLRAGIDLQGGAIQILTFPRIFGFVFVPLSLYYCRDADGRLRAVLYEVNNTFGDRHTYLIPVGENAAGRIAHGCDKVLFVSPFIPVVGRYDFKIIQPGDRLSVVIRESDAEGALLTAAFTGERQDFSDRTLLQAFARYPLMTLKVIAAIHWQALKLVAKGLRLVPRPAAPAAPVSMGK